MNIEQAVKHGKHWLAAGWVWDAGQVALVYVSGRWETWSVPGSDIGSWPLWTRGLSMVPDMRNRGTLGHALGQVQDAWGCDEWRRLTIECAGRGWCIIIRNARHRPPSRAQPGWDLDSVAHPRYRNTPGPFGNNEFPCMADALLAARRAAP